MAAGALPAAEAAVAETHLAGCQACRDYFGQIEAVSRGVQELSQSQAVPSPAFDAHWRAAVAAAAEPRAPFNPLGWLAAWARLAWAANRPALAGLGAVWLAIAFFRLTAPQIPDTRPPRPPLPSPRVILSVLKLQDRLLHPQYQSGPEPAPRAVRPLQPRQRTELPAWPTMTRTAMLAALPSPAASVLVHVSPC